MVFRLLLALALVLGCSAFQAPVGSQLSRSMVARPAISIDMAAKKKAAKKVVKKKAPAGDASFLTKLFSLSFVGGAQGVDLADEYKL